MPHLRPCYRSVGARCSAARLALPLAALLASGVSAAVGVEAVWVGVADTMVKIPREPAAVGSLGAEALAAIRWGGTLRLELARGELESAQLVLAVPADRALADVRVSVGPLLRRRAGGDVPWPTEDIRLWRVGFVDAHNLWEPHQSLGWLPDPLLPLQTAFDIPAGTLQPVWLRFRAAEALPPGLYRGEVTVEARGADPVRVPLRVTVWDFTLPPTQHFTLSIPVWGGQWEAMYPGAVTAERRREYLDMLLQYRVSPFPLDPEAELEHCFGRGQRAFCLHCFPVDSVPPDTTERMADLQEMWLRRPFAPEATPYVLLGDEASPVHYPNIQEQGRLVRGAAPLLQRLFTLSPENTTKGHDYAFSELAGSADTTILGAANCYDVHRHTELARAAGLGVWWYYVASHYYIPGRGLEVRQVFWRHWKYRVPGQLHWGASYWGDGNIAGQGGARWPEIPWDSRCSRAGDGYLVYPAPDGTEMWPSVRLELLRDGVEDYEYFHLLRTLLETAPADEELLTESRRLLALDDGLVESYSEYSTRPGAYRSYRARLARAIVNVQAVGAAPR